MTYIKAMKDSAGDAVFRRSGPSVDFKLMRALTAASGYKRTSKIRSKSSFATESGVKPPEFGRDDEG